MDNNLLLVDLCGRLLYGVYIKHIPTGITGKLNNINVIHIYNNTNSVQEVKVNISFFGEDYVDVTHFKLYLRPMSSITEEEFAKLKGYSGLVYDQLDLASFQNGTYKCLDFYLSEVPADVVTLVFDWLNAHHFDYRGLIEKGLALEAPKGMYKID